MMNRRGLLKGFANVAAAMLVPLRCVRNYAVPLTNAIIVRFSIFQVGAKGVHRWRSLPDSQPMIVSAGDGEGIIVRIKSLPANSPIITFETTWHELE